MKKPAIPSKAIEYETYFKSLDIYTANKVLMRLRDILQIKVLEDDKPKEIK